MQSGEALVSYSNRLDIGKMFFLRYLFRFLQFTFFREICIIYLTHLVTS